jgi:hypothetical protein
MRAAPAARLQQLTHCAEAQEQDFVKCPPTVMATQCWLEPLHCIAAVPQQDMTGVWAQQQPREAGKKAITPAGTAAQ